MHLLSLSLLLFAFRHLTASSHGFSSCSRDCEWLPDDLEEEYLHIARVMEKSILRAVIFLQQLSS